MEYLEFITEELILFTGVYTIVVLVLNSMWLHPKDLETWKEWNGERNNRTRELKKRIKDWNNRRNQKLRAWKEWGREQLKNFKAWWEKDVLPEWEKATSFKKIYIVFSCIIGVILSILFLALCLQIIVTLLGLSNIDEIDSNFALAFLGTISGGVALFTGYIAILRSETNTRQNEIADKQAITAEEGLITDRINKAVENLGKSENGIPVIEVRIGAIYALERIAKDSERDHVPIMELFSAYIRTNSSNDNQKTPDAPLREDVTTILEIISRRDQWTPNKGRLEIERIQEMRFDFYNCYLRRAELYGADLSGANFYKADLQHAWLNRVNLSRARLTDTNINGADLADVKTNGAHAYTGDFSKCKNLTQEQLDVMYCGMGVTINKEAKPEEFIRPDHWPTDSLSYDKFMKSYREWKKPYDPNH